LDKIHTDVLEVSMAENKRKLFSGFKIFLVSRISGKVFQEKPMLLMSTSDGKEQQMFWYC
jgi:hypothetical protein